MLRFLSAGESHGKALTGIIEGMVSNLNILPSDINRELARRQKGYGRGKRMEIEKDSAEILSGVRDGKTTGGPVSFLIKNKDWENWHDIMDVEKKNAGGERYIPRPGHADLPGIIKYGFDDIRNVIERSSARETAVRTAVGAVCKKLLAVLGIQFYSRVIQIGSVFDNSSYESLFENYAEIDESDVRNIYKSDEMRAAIDEAKSKGESIGGVFEIIVDGLIPGLGSYVHWDRRLDALISGGLMSIPGIKGVEIGAGFAGMQLPGSSFHDKISMDLMKGVRRAGNNAGGIEGGVTNGEKVWAKCAMKPIPTLKKPLSSFDIRSGNNTESFYERSDICGVVPASVVGENFLAFIICREVLVKFGGDTLTEIQQRYKSCKEELERNYKK